MAILAPRVRYPPVRRLSFSSDLRQLVLYNNVLVEFFKAPPLTIKSGKIFWIALIPVYWTIAYIIGAAIPDFVGFTGVVAATCILNFTYSFPPLLHLAYYTKRNAAQPERGFDPMTGEVSVNDRGLRRLIRGFFGHRWYLNIFNLLYSLAALSMCGLGTYASVENLIMAYSKPAYNAFSCHSPLQ